MTCDQDEVEVEVFNLTAVRIQAPLVALSVGTEVCPSCSLLLCAAMFFAACTKRSLDESLILDAGLRDGVGQRSEPSISGWCRVWPQVPLESA